MAALPICRVGIPFKLVRKQADLPFLPCLGARGPLHLNPSVHNPYGKHGDPLLILRLQSLWGRDHLFVQCLYSTQHNGRGPPARLAALIILQLLTPRTWISFHTRFQQRISHQDKIFDIVHKMWTACFVSGQSKHSPLMPAFLFGWYYYFSFPNFSIIISYF